MGKGTRRGRGESKYSKSNWPNKRRTLHACVCVCVQSRVGWGHQKGYAQRRPCNICTRKLPVRAVLLLDAAALSLWRAFARWNAHTHTHAHTQADTHLTRYLCHTTRSYWTECDIVFAVTCCNSIMNLMNMFVVELFFYFCVLYW